MKKFTTAFFFVLISFILLPQPILAFNKTRETSANFKQFVPSPPATTQMPDIRVKKLEYFLERHNSSLSLYKDVIIKAADDYQLPWTLVTAIAGVESGFCRSIPMNSYNCWGWNNGKFFFQDYQDGIQTVSKNLRLKYFDRGLDTPEKMSYIYAPPSKSWATKVRHLMEQIENYQLPAFLAIPLAI